MAITLEFTKRFWRSVGRHSEIDQHFIETALDLFRRDPSHAALHFKKRKNSRFYSIRANFRVRIAMIQIAHEHFSVVLAGNHDDIDSLDHQGR